MIGSRMVDPKRVGLSRPRLRDDQIRSGLEREDRHGRYAHHTCIMHHAPSMLPNPPLNCAPTYKLLQRLVSKNSGSMDFPTIFIFLGFAIFCLGSIIYAFRNYK